MSTPNYARTKRACFFANLASSSVFSLPPLLFMTFREMYGISYTLLGTLISVNFCTQLSIDLIFSFFTKYFNIKKTVRIMPLLTSAGLIVYALIPWLLPQYAYAGLLIGTVLFSVAAGLGEVLISPVVAAIPSEHPEKDMSLLHSLYAWGLVFVILISTLFLHFCGTHNWMYLTLFFAVLPIIASVLFCTSPMPPVNVSHGEGATPAAAKKRGIGMALCVACIFLGSAAENVMTNWISGYMETALQVAKVVGDVFGMALFAILLGFGRTLYAKFGRNISNVLLAGMMGAVVCYLTAGLCNTPIVALIACVLTGFCTSMLWPGTLILMEEKMPNPGIVAYALMAAGGDFGASIAPQAMGIVVDTVSVSAWAQKLSLSLGITTEQIGMKTGMLLSAIFPLLGIGLLLFMKRYFRKENV
jgi:MFS family permease